MKIVDIHFLVSSLEMEIVIIHFFVSTLEMEIVIIHFFVSTLEMEIAITRYTLYNYWLLMRSTHDEVHIVMSRLKLKVNNCFIK
jgi:hypothetical protein